MRWLNRLHDVEIPAERDHGRPGERLRLPAPPLVYGIATPEFRSDFAAVVGRDCLLDVACLGPTAAVGDPRDYAGTYRAALLQRGNQEVGDVCPDAVIDPAGVRLRVDAPVGAFTGWYFAHLGWLFAATLLSAGPADSPALTARVRDDVLTTWCWIEPAA